MGLTGTGHHGGMVLDTVLLFGDARSVKLLQKVNLKLMLGYTITHMESGHLGGQDMEDTVLVFMDARSVKLLQKVNPMLTLGCTTTHMEYGQLGTLDTIVSTDGNGVTLPVNYSLFPPNHENSKTKCSLFFKIKELLNVQLAKRLKSGNSQPIRSI